MGINTRRVKSLNNSCEMCDVSVVKLYEQNDERLVPNFRIISADNPKLIPFFSLTRSVSYFFDLITICLLHMYHLTELKLIKVRHSTNVHFYSIITDDKKSWYIFQNITGYLRNQKEEKMLTMEKSRN